VGTNGLANFLKLVDADNAAKKAKGVDDAATR
jgi:hypothetical protein